MPQWSTTEDLTPERVTIEMDDGSKVELTGESVRAWWRASLLSASICDTHGARPFEGVFSLPGAVKTLPRDASRKPV